MKKLFILLGAIALTCNLMAVNVWDGGSEPWTNGSGTMEDPYLIETAANLAYLAEKVNEGYEAQGMAVFKNVYFLMTDDLDLNNINWTPIGNVNMNMEGFYFAGIFDGWYHNIDHLRIQSNADVCGLFAGLGGEQGPPPSDLTGQIRHLSVTNGNITSTGTGVGGIVGGMAGEALVFQCSFSGTISGSNGGSFCGAGGIVAAMAESSRVVECSFQGSINATNSAFTGAAGAGGIVGIAMDNATVNECFNTGSVTGSAILLSVAAGILGATLQENQVSIYSCYNVGTLNGSTKGGIFGMVSPINPMKGEASIDVGNCFYLNTCGGTTAYGTSMTSDEMKTEQFKNQIDMSSHSFVMDNGTNNGYPVHSLASFRYYPVADITCHSAKLSAQIHQGNDDIARAYFLYKHWESDEWIEIDVPIDGYVEVLLEDLEPETYYEYGLTLMFADGIMMSGGPRGFQTDIYDAVSDHPAAVSIYPNPAADVVHVDGVDVVEVRVYTILGQLMKTVNSTEINVSDLPEGVYLLRIIDDDGGEVSARCAHVSVCAR